MALGATRVIYPEGQKQVQLAVTSNDEKSTYLIQSWVENANGDKDSRFVITPPLFAIKGKKETTLRILDAVVQDQLAIAAAKGQFFCRFLRGKRQVIRAVVKFDSADDRQLERVLIQL